MLNLSPCPRCLRMVTLPDGVDAATQVRCPLCSAEYSLGEAIPPALIIVSKTELSASPTKIPTPVTGLLTEPFFSQGPTIAPPAKESESSFEATSEENATSETPDDFALDFAEHLAESEALPAEDESDHDRDLALDTGEYAMADDKPLGGTALVKNIASERPRQTPRTKPLVKPLPPRRKRKKRGPIRLLLEWTLGGAMSVLIAYYGIWWIRGESAGIPRFDWLPGLPAEGYGAKPNPQLTPPVKPAGSPHSAESDARTKPSVAQTNPAEKTAVPTNRQPLAEQVPGDSSSPTETNKIPPPETARDVSDEDAVKSADEKTDLPDKTALANLTANKPLPMPRIGPRPSADFNFYDLDNSLQAVSDAFFAVGKVNAENYPAFCKLAEVQTDIAPNKVPSQQEKNVADFLGNIAADPKQIAEIGRLAGEAVKNAGEQPGGIVLAGKATKVSSKNNMYGANIKLPDGATNVTVLSGKPLNFKADEDVLIAGRLIAKPVENIAGYQGTATLAVWQGVSIPIPAPSK